MAISSSLYSSISGLSSMGEAMSVLGDNVANVNTVSFKSSRSTFQDVLSQSVSTAAGSAQVGRGVTLSTVDGLFAQGSFESSSTPTDMAIGGDGFFMLRDTDSAEANMYSRAGEFRFDQEGNLVNPSGYFAQGWSIDENTGDREGTIGDINIGKTTPPIESEDIQIIFNLDSREQNETTETRLFDAWNGTNSAAVSPTDPIAATNYEYTSSIKIYDAQGASHDITVYFSRTTNDNEWEFLVTCEPAEDIRNLDPNDPGLLANYAPDDTYNYENHKGAGALMYGTINYNTSGEITRMNCWEIPPDGKVDPALNDNRIILNTGDSYYSFECNFTGATTNQEISLNIGAKWNGARPSQEQIIVSDGGAFSDNTGTTSITEETLWGSIYDSTGSVMVGDGVPANSDSFTLQGYHTDGTELSVALGTELVYTIDDTKKVSDFLKEIETTFGCSASIDAKGRLKLTDESGEPYRLAITDFDFTPLAPGAVNPFQGILSEVQINVTTSKQKVYSPGRGLTASGTPIDANTRLVDVWDSAAVPVKVAVDDTFVIDGFKGDGSAVVASTFPPAPAVGITDTDRVQDFLEWMENLLDCEAEIDTNGRLVLTDRVADESGGYSSALEITSMAYTAAAPWGTTVPPGDPWDFIPSDLGTEDGSIEGGTINNEFASEALASTQYANSSTTIYQDQDGYASGFLQSVSVDTDGVITGHYSNGQVIKKAQVALATFNSLHGLYKKGGNIFEETTDSGAPITGAPQTNGLGSIAPNALEMSNVDLGTEFVKLITVQRGFQANSKIITTTDEMLADLINIKR